MPSPRSITRLLPLFIAAASISQVSAADIAARSGSTLSPLRAQAIANFQAANAGANFSEYTDGRLSRVYGRAFSHGPTPEVSAQRFIDQHINMWGLGTNELIAKGPFQDGHHTQPIGYEPLTDSYKFTGKYYTQVKGGLTVYASGLTLLIRNDADSPLVLASSQLHDLSGFQPDANLARAAANKNLIAQNAQLHYNGKAVVLNTERVIFAGVENKPHAPVVADSTLISIDGYKKFLVITDAATGAILHDEPMTHTIDISGNVSGLATEGIAADYCEDEVPFPLPYLRVSAPGVSVFTDVNGDFTLPNPGVTPVNVSATLDGKWFEISDYAASVQTQSVNATPPGPADMVFNAANNNEGIRAQVNAYVEANRVRDFAIRANPSYPTLNNQGFPIVVNRTDGYCPGNAWYDGSLQSLNFCRSGSSYPNTAWSSVVMHEYGHHLVQAGGSGQGGYGEGMGDVMSTIILDSPALGQGFFGSCSTSLRTADNNMQYPCTSDGHTCAQLISACVWDTRQVLVVTEPADYTEILNFLAVNAILVHRGSDITPDITIDWLTLDDDDADIGNGTPHYFEINTGFSAHNMAAPPLNLVDISFPQSRPDLVSPNGTTTMAVEFQDLAGTLDPATPKLMADTGSGFSAYPLTQISGGMFQATFPASDCGTQVNYYVTADTTNGQTQVSPAGAPASTYSAIAAFDLPAIAFSDNFESNTGWAVSGNVTGRNSGQWERGVPAGDGSRGDAPSDYDGSGQCYVTGNGGPGSNTDVDGGSTILTSPVMDASGTPVISYARWYDNTGSGTGGAPGADIFVVEVSDNAGASWTNLETVGPSTPESSGGWFAKQFSLTDIPGFQANDQFRIRFTASDLATGSVIEAAVDAIELSSFDCSPCVADLNGDGTLDFFDVSAFLNAFNASDPIADLDGNGSFDFFDISTFLNAFSAGCP